MKFKSSVYTQVSGSVGGLTYAHNKGGMYSRSRSIPTNPNTERQTAPRAGMTNLVQAWNELTQGNRDSWDIYAANVTVLGKLGDPISISGQNHFIRSNLPRQNVFIQTAANVTPVPLATINTAPVIFNTGEKPSSLIAADITAGALGVTFGISAPASAAGNALLQVGLPLNDGKTFYKGPWQLAKTVPVLVTDDEINFVSLTLTDPDDWYSNYIPSITSTMKVRIRITYNDGRLSDALEVPMSPVDGD